MKIAIGLLFAMLLAACGSSPRPVDYNAGMSAQMSALGAFSADVAPLLDNPQFGDQQWTLQVAQHGATISTVYESIAALKPPSKQLSKHLAILSGVGDCAAAMKALTLAADANRLDFVPVSIGLINRCAVKMKATANQ